MLKMLKFEKKKEKIQNYQGAILWIGHKVVISFNRKLPFGVKKKYA